jgi:hypothetical protein
MRSELSSPFTSEIASLSRTHKPISRLRHKTSDSAKFSFPEMQMSSPHSRGSFLQKKSHFLECWHHFFTLTAHYADRMWCQELFIRRPSAESSAGFTRHVSSSGSAPHTSCTLGRLSPSGPPPNSAARVCRLTASRLSESDQSETHRASRPGSVPDSVLESDGITFLC